MMKNLKNKKREIKRKWWGRTKVSNKKKMQGERDEERVKKRMRFNLLKPRQIGEGKDERLEKRKIYNLMLR